MHWLNQLLRSIRASGNEEEEKLERPWARNRGMAFSMTLLVACVTSNAACAQPSPFRFLQKPGPYTVGLKVVDQYDRSRTFAGGPRPIQTLVWYPATGSMRKPMTVGDYAQLAATVIHFAPIEKPDEWVAKLAASADVRLRAIRGATLAKGHFPVVVYAPGQSSVAWDNADLCEYLASHGYVVLASPSVGKSTRDANDNIGDIDAEALDISFLVSYAKTLPNTDLSKVAVAGWSWGGISNLFAAEHDDRIKALIAYDGSMRYYPALVKKAGVRPDRMTIPLLFFTREYLSLEDWDRYATADNHGPSVLNEWTHGDLWTTHMLGMSHPAFASMYQRAESDKRFGENQMADYGREDVNVSYAWVARYTLAFLDAYLKDDTSQRAFLKNAPVDNGVPKHFMSITFRASTPLR